MSLFGAFVFSGKSFCQNRDIKWPKTGQICTIIYAHVPFWDFPILNLNDLPKSGHATLCTIHNMQSCINAWHVICSQKMKKISLPNLAKCYHFVIILLSSSGLMNDGSICMTPFSMRHTVIVKISCWNLANVIILLSLLLITFQQENAPIGAFF
jgi:hypothetical protein